MTELAIVVGAKYLAALPVVVVAYCLLRAKSEERWRLGLMVLAALPLAYVLARFAGLFYTHPQPFALWEGDPLIPHEIDNAFPSDHALFAGALAAIVGRYTRSWVLGGALFVVAGLVGLCRVAAGLHNWIDVSAALVLGVGAVFVADSLLKRCLPLDK
jgi:membrane-associated phospholipid phosphatase